MTHDSHNACDERAIFCVCLSRPRRICVFEHEYEYECASENICISEKAIDKHTCKQM